MQLLCIAALLLSAVAAKPDSRRPWQNGPKLDSDSKHGDDVQSVTPAPEDGDGGSGVIDWPFGYRGPSKGKKPNRRNPGAMNTTAVPLKEGGRHGPPKDGQVKLIHNATEPAPGFMSDEGRRQFGRQRRPASVKRRNPGAMVFSPMIKVDNVTFQAFSPMFKNTTAVPLKEGENIFLMPKHGGGGPHHDKGGRHGPPKDGQYVKLIYNATEPNKVSIEFGVFKPMNLGEFVGEEDNPEEDY